MNLLIISICFKSYLKRQATVLCHTIWTHIENVFFHHAISSVFLELGLLKIFNHFIKVSDILNSVPTILKAIAEDLVNDIRGLIPEVEALASKYNLTDPLLSEVSKALDMNKVINDTIPELEKVLSF